LAIHRHDWLHRELHPVKSDTYLDILANGKWTKGHCNVGDPIDLNHRRDKDVTKIAKLYAL
jgi:hypothetical protein